MHLLGRLVSFLVYAFLFLGSSLHPVSGQTDDMTTEDYRIDSMVNYYLRNYEFTKALQTTADYRQRTVKDTKKNAYWLLKTGQIYYYQGNLKSGNDMLNKAKGIMQQLNNPGHLLQFQYAFLQGRHSYIAGRFDEALQWFRKAETHSAFIKNQDPVDNVWFYGAMGNLLCRLDAYHAAIRYYEMAIKAVPGNSFLDLHEINSLKIRQADAYLKTGERDKSDMLVQNCLAYVDTATNPLHPALMDPYLNLIDYSNTLADNYSTTRNLLQNATRILQRSFPADHYYAGILYTKKARQEYMLSDFENTLQYCKHAIQILSKYPYLNSLKQLNYINIARIHYWLERDYVKTINFSRQAIDSLENTELSPAYFYYMIGRSYLQLKNIPLAVANLKKVISLTADQKRFRNNLYCSAAYEELGNIYVKQKNHAAGRNYLLTALAYAKRMSPNGYAVTNINEALGNSYLTMHEYHKALFYFQRSIIAGCHTFSDTAVFANPALEDIILTQNLIMPLSRKAYAFYLLYEKDVSSPAYLENALACQELAVRLIEKRLADIDEERSGMIISDLRNAAMNNAVSYATLLYLKTGSSNYADKAWEYAEKSKMQVLSINTVKRKNLLYSGLPDTLIRKYEKLHNEILTVENQLALEEKDESVDGSGQEALAKLARLYDQRDELVLRLEEDYPAYARLKYKFTVAGIDQVQQILEKDQALVEYQVLSTEIITFVITKSDYAIYFQLIDNEVPDNITRLRRILSSNPLQSDPMLDFQTFVSSSSYLYKKLIEPIYNRIEGKRLVIVPHNQLTQIPFEVLIREKPEKDSQPDYRSLRYLIREFPITYAFSANLLTDKNDKKFGSGTAIFLPDYESSGDNIRRDSLLLSLEGAAYEARAIRRLTIGKLYSQDKADESTFKSRAYRYRILHISSHSVMDETDPDLSYLAMTAPSDTTEDGNLYSYEISQMKLQAQLVVLSGCNTGYGLLRRSEGLVSIARSFLYTGIRTVAFTLWPVADRAGSNLVSSFYKALRSRSTLDKALRKAKLSILEEADPVMAHPYYWAGYIVAGNTDAVPVFRLSFWIIIFISSVAMVFLLVFLYRKINA